MIPEKIFLLFGSSGNLGKTAVEFFLKQEYDYYYFFSRENFLPLQLGISGEVINEKKNFEIIKTGDLLNEENVAAAFARVKKKNDASYFLFSTVGGFWGGKTIAETDYENWQKMIKINLDTSFLIAKYFFKLVENTSGGSICFTSALSSLKPEVKKAAYNISKNALNFLVNTLALEGKEIGLSANAVAPFIIDSPSNRQWVKDKFKMTSAIDICKIVQLLFTNYKTMNGNIISEIRIQNSEGKR